MYKRGRDHLQKDKMDIIKRINRAEGQLRGIKKMLQEGRDCQEIIQQISAVSQAIKKINEKVIQNYIHQYIRESSDVNFKDNLSNLITNIL